MVIEYKYHSHTGKRLLTDEEKCQRKIEGNKKYSAKNRDKILKAQTKYREKHREEIRAKQNKYYQDNIEKEREQKRQYYHTEQGKATRKKYYEKLDKNKVKEWNEKHRKNLKIRLKNDPEFAIQYNTKQKSRRLEYNFGITFDQFTNLLNEQDSKCLMCKKVLVDDIETRSVKNKPCVDHDHKTGHIRGILCFNCNHLVGYMEQSDYVVKQGFRYLKKYTEKYRKFK